MELQFSEGNGPNLLFILIKIVDYLGSILNADNKMNIEIAERLAKGNKAYYANAKLIKLKFLKKKSK
jgi:ubiquitin-protein ligase